MSAAHLAETDDEKIGTAIDEMYAMISSPAGPRDWSRQANCFLPEARQVRNSIDDEGRPHRITVTGLLNAINSSPRYSRDTTSAHHAPSSKRHRPCAAFPLDSPLSSKI